MKVKQKMYAEQHPEAEQISQPTQDFVDYLNGETEEGRMTNIQSQTILKLARLMIEEATGDFYL